MRVPTFVFRGLRRQLIRKLQNSLLSIAKMDLREGLKAAAHGVDADLFATGDNTPEGRAIQKLLDRIDELLELKR